MSAGRVNGNYNMTVARPSTLLDIFARRVRFPVWMTVEKAHNVITTVASIREGFSQSRGVQLELITRLV
jgi:hypothetical protein